MSIVKDFLRENFCRNSSRIKSEKPRIEFIDLAKGICILLVVLMHCGFTKGLPLLGALRMPLYFILSGLFFKDYGSLFNLIIKKTNRLIIPLMFFASIELLIISFQTPLSILDNIALPFIKPGIMNFPTWFLLCLFWVNIFYYFIHTKCHKIYTKIIFVTLLGFIGATLSYYEVYLPLFMSSAFSATPFFFVGVMLRKTPILYKTNHDKSLLLLGLTLLIATITYCYLIHTPRISFLSNSYSGNYLEIFIVAVCSVVGLMLLCKAIKWLPFISYIGRYSIIVLGMHILVRNYAYLPLYKITHHTFNEIEILCLTLLLCWFAIPIIKTTLPKLSAQQDLIKLKRHS